MNDEQTMQEINGIGRIKVQFERGQFLNKKVARSTEAKSFDPPEQIDTVASSQKAVEKHGLSHVLKYGVSLTFHVERANKVPGTSP